MSKSRELYLFSSKYKILNIRNKIPLKVNFYEENDFYFVIDKLKGINFSIDEISCSIYFEKLISSKFYINAKVDPCYHFKSIIILGFMILYIQIILEYNIRYKH